MGIWITAGAVLAAALLVRWRHALRGWLLGGSAAAEFRLGASAGQFVHGGGMRAAGLTGRCQPSCLQSDVVIGLSPERNEQKKKYHSEPKSRNGIFPWGQVT